MTTVLCGHCAKRPMCRPYGLCWDCYYTPSVRAAGIAKDAAITKRQLVLACQLQADQAAVQQTIINDRTWEETS